MAALLMFAGFGLFATGAGAETLWVYPDRNPFRGTFDDALNLFAARGIPRPVLDQQRRLYLSGRCARRRIMEGEHIALMTFGKNRVLTDVVAETNSWPNQASRDATLCLAAIEGREYALLRPDVCGNWSEEKLPPRSSAPVPASPAVLDEQSPLSGIPSGAARLAEGAGGAGGLSSPAGFALPAVPSGVPAGEFSGSPGFVLPVVPPGDDLRPTRFVRPIILPDISLNDPQSAPNPPDSPGPPPAHVPEPASGLLFGAALAALVLARRVFRPQRADAAAGAAGRLNLRDTRHRHRVPPR